MTPEEIGHWIGVFVGAGVVGSLLGLLPLILAKKQGRNKLGWIGFGSTFVGALILGAILAIPVSGIFSIYIYFTKETPSNKIVDSTPES